jgi:general secretion pathway protein G
MQPRQQTTDRGFTLLELLAVVVVLGLLAMVAVIAASAVRDNSVASACAADRRAVETAVEVFYATQGSSTLPTDDPMEALVDAGFLRSPSGLHSVETDGELIKISGSGECFDGLPEAATMMRVMQSADTGGARLMRVDPITVDLKDD